MCGQRMDGHNLLKREDRKSGRKCINKPGAGV